MSELDFFNDHYKTLRPAYTPMEWMRRMFLRLIGGEPPSLVDLPTGAGKTDLVVIWLIALAWYAQHRGTTKPVPRRLVWVVNRRVLVQQVFDVAESLNATLKAPSGAAEELADHLRFLCKQNSEVVFNVVQLRGQRLDDREWSLDPTMPQLIIGTVDQIGSRLLFQGYGLGKWSRPMHAGLFGVDAWVCVDEAHLVPAFAVTLRQIREMACRPLDASVPESIAKFFDQLPFWITELSATPGLPAPKHGKVFPLETEDESDDVIADRLLAKETRRVIWKPQPEKKHLVRDMADEARRIAKENPGSAIAVFCHRPDDAKEIAKKIETEYKGRVLLVTGRIRGYERDRLAQSELFQRFRKGHPEMPTAGTPPTFLIGTAAAEVGLDADASAIICDFADLLTLVQRLGRLDRRGQLSKRAKAAKTPPPTMTIIGGSNGKTTQAQLTALAAKLSASRPANGFEYGAEFFTGAPWSVVVGKEKDESEDEESASSRPKQAHGLEADDIIQFHALKTKFLKSQDKVSVWLRSQFSKASLAEINDSTSPKKIIEGLNAAMKGAIYEIDRFAEVKLRPKTAKLRDKNPKKGESLLKLNRWLLEDAFPNEISTGAKFGVDDAKDSATWRVAGLSLVGSEDNEDAEGLEDAQPVSEGGIVSEGVTTNISQSPHEGRQPGNWLNNPLAAITAGPVAVPPLSDAVLKRWAATTPRLSKFLPVHPWLYGLLPDDEGIPLVGVAFRLELDILQHCCKSDEDDGDTDRTWEKIGKCLTLFPPLNSELHFVPLGKAREWLQTLPNEQRPAMAHFDGEEWTNSILPDELNTNSLLVLPTSMSPSVVKEVIDKAGDENESQRCWDVFEALAKDGAKYRRTITIKSGQIKPDQNKRDVYRVLEFGTESESPKTAGEKQTEPSAETVAAPDDTKWKAAGMKLSFTKDGISFDLCYFKPRRDAGTELDLLPDHLAAAGGHGRQLAQALAPNNAPLAALVSRTAADHDKGKDHVKWQQAMGNSPKWRNDHSDRISERLEQKGRKDESSDTVLVAKSVIENPGHVGGYRHEWGTLWRIKGDITPILSGTDAATATFLRDLYLHGIAAHHGYFRPSMPDRGFDCPPTATKQNRLRLESIERSARLQRQLGYWRLAYLESLIKIADVAASRDAQTEETDDES
jgi:hypothetical protein